MPDTINTAATAAAGENTPAAQETSTQNDTSTTAAERTYTQADVDRMITDRLSRERRKHQQDIEAARTAARTEAEELARMTAEQRAEQEARQREQALNQREAEITRRELRAQAIDTLISRDLPHELEGLLDYSSADACSASIDTVGKIFRQAVQAAVDARLKTSGVILPAPGAKPDYAKMSDADYYASVYPKK